MNDARTHISRVYSLMSIDTLACTLKEFVTYFSNARPFNDMIVQMPEHSLMGKYSLSVFCALILYNIIDGRYVIICSDGRLILSVTFLTIICLHDNQEESS